MQECVYAPVNNKINKGRTEIKRFWKDFGQCLKRLKRQGRVFVQRDMTDKFGIMEIWGVVGKWSTDGVKGTGQYLTRSCLQRDILLSKHLSAQAYLQINTGRKE